MDDDGSMIAFLDTNVLGTLRGFDPAPTARLSAEVRRDAARLARGSLTS